MGLMSNDGETLPVVCTLGASDGLERMRRWRELHQTARPASRREGSVLEIRYPASDGVRSELERLAAAESECCCFVTWAVVSEPPDVVLRIIADPASPDDLNSIAVMFGVR
jgi:hypothetical protein